MELFVLQVVHSPLQNPVENISLKKVNSLFNLEELFWKKTLVHMNNLSLILILLIFYHLSTLYGKFLKKCHI
jgi:hypothetical protein